MEKLTLVIIAALSFIPVASAGGMSTGGGAAAVCRDPVDHQVISAQFLDLYEGSVMNNYTYGDPTASPEVNLQGALSHASTAYYRALLNQVSTDIVTRFVFLPPGVAINAPPDLGTGFAIPIPEGCALEATGYYDENGNLQISRSVYAALSNQDKAAFVLHEAIYKIARLTAGATDSSSSRAFNSALFATNSTASSILGFEATNIFAGYIPNTNIGFSDGVTSVATGKEDDYIHVSFIPGILTKPYLASLECYDLSGTSLQTLWVGEWASGEAPISGTQTIEVVDNPKCYFLSISGFYAGVEGGPTIPFNLATADTVFYTATSTQNSIFLAHDLPTPTIPVSF